MQPFDDMQSAIKCLSLWQNMQDDPGSTLHEVRQIMNDTRPEGLVPALLEVGSLLLAQMAKDRGLTDDAGQKAFALDHLQRTSRELRDIEAQRPGSPQG